MSAEEKRVLTLDGLEKIYQEQYDHLLKYSEIISKSKENHGDFLHDIFEKIRAKIEKDGGETEIKKNPINYIKVAIRHTFLDHCKQQSKEIEKRKYGGFDISESNEFKSRFYNGEVYKLIREIKSLNEKDKELLDLIYLEFDNSEIQQILELKSVQMVAVKKNRLFNKIRVKKRYIYKKLLQ